MAHIHFNPCCKITLVQRISLENRKISWKSSLSKKAFLRVKIVLKNGGECAFSMMIVNKQYLYDDKIILLPFHTAKVTYFLELI